MKDTRTKADLLQEIEHAQDVIIRQVMILRGVCDALRGPHPNGSNTTYSVHDMAKWARQRMRELKAAQAKIRKLQAPPERRDTLG